MVPALLKALGIVSSPIGRALGVGLIAVAALGYAYMKGEERAAVETASLRGQVEAMRADLRITQRAAETAAAQEAQAEARAATLSERLQTYETGLADPPAGGVFTDDDVRSLRELTR